MKIEANINQLSNKTKTIEPWQIPLTNKLTICLKELTTKLRIKRGMQK